MRSARMKRLRELKSLCCRCAFSLHLNQLSQLKMLFVMMLFLVLVYILGMLGTLFYSVTVMVNGVAVNGSARARHFFDLSANWRISGLFFRSESFLFRNYQRFESCVGCFPHNFGYIIRNDHICRPTYPGQRIDLFIVILTRHEKWRARHAIRNSWISVTKNNTSNVRYAFLLGDVKKDKLQRKILKENRLHRDFVQEDFIDSYLNLTYKTIMGFKLAVTKCGNASYVLKTDDDVYVNVQSVLKVLRTDGGMLHEGVGGARTIDGMVIRDKTSKWYASVESYPNYYYPDFCSGTGYVTSMHAARAIYDVSPDVPYFHLEDVYVGMCLAKLRYWAKPIRGFLVDNSKFELCDYKRDGVLTVHRIPPLLLYSIWNERC